jgi:hypothetical protein
MKTLKTIWNFLFNHKTICGKQWIEESMNEKYGIVESLPIQALRNCTRVEVIDQKGRSYVNWKPTNKVRLSMQDDGKTVKIFID